MRCLPKTLRSQDEDKICDAIKSGEVETEALSSLRKVNSWNIREAIANATNASANTLDIMMNDGDPSIQKIAAKRLLPDQIKALSNIDTANIGKLARSQKPIEVPGHTNLTICPTTIKNNH